MLARGLAIRLDDVQTGFPGNKRGRPYVVVGWMGDPPHTYVVAARSASSPTGVALPAGQPPGAKKPGRVQYLARTVSAQAAEAAETMGMLEEPWRSRVLEDVNAAAYDLD